MFRRLSRTASPLARPPRSLTRELWEHFKRHGFTSEGGGQRFILQLDRATGRTVLQPVTVEGLS